MRYRLQRHDGTDCSATMVPFTVLRMVPIQRYRQDILLRNRFNRYSLCVSIINFLLFPFLREKPYPPDQPGRYGSQLLIFSQLLI